MDHCWSDLLAAWRTYCGRVAVHRGWRVVSTMLLGDALEIAGAGCLTAAAYLWDGWVPALIVAGVALIYLAQCYASIMVRPKIKLPKVKLPWLLRKAPEA
jgi:hypothetical protein